MSIRKLQLPETFNLPAKNYKHPVNINIMKAQHNKFLDLSYGNSLLYANLQKMGHAVVCLFSNFIQLLDLVFRKRVCLQGYAEARASRIKGCFELKTQVQRRRFFDGHSFSVICVGLLLLNFNLGVAQAKTYTVGVVPQQAAAVLARTWSPMLTYLEKKSGVSLSFKTAPNIPEFEKRLANGEYDFAYMNPYHYIVYHQKPGYLAIAKEKDTKLQGLIVVRKDSEINDLKQLSGKGLAFPAPASFAASVLPRLQLKKLGIDFTPNFVSSHDSVYFSVARGIYPAGGGVGRTFNSTPAKIRDQLRVLWRTDSYTPHAFAVHPGVDESAVQAVAKAMYEMSADATTADILKNVNLKGWVPGVDTDWDDLRSLDLKELDAPVKK